jgi:uncharacterized membrane protein YeaQ/YmgE (transglycosylase-associated protein family)
MPFIIGFTAWLVIGLLGAFIVRATFRGPDTTGLLSIAFGIFGAFIGGMLGTSAHIFHNPVPLRIGGVIGAISGALIFSFIYHFAARHAV